MAVSLETLEDEEDCRRGFAGRWRLSVGEGGRRPRSFRWNPRSSPEYAKAESLYQQALAIAKNAFGEQHPDYALSLYNLAVSYDSIDEYAKAEPLYQRALTINKRVLGEQHPQYARDLNNLTESVPVDGRVRQSRVVEQTSSGNQ